MKYRSFEITNFRGIKSLKLALPDSPQIITLIGLNESGKTTILEALNYFKYNTESLEPLDIKGYGIKDPNSLIPISKKFNFNETIKIQAEVQLEQADVLAVEEELRSSYKVKATTLNPQRVTMTQELIFKDSVFVRTNYKWSLRIL